MTIESFLSGKTVLITGGTGSFGRKITERVLEMPVKRIVILSRDEKKQYDMRCKLGVEYKVKFMVGDVRDAARVEEAMRGVDVVFHAAALKQVPQCEEHPFEAVMTNIVGAQNVKRAAIRNQVGLVLAVSTDKAVKPVNVMGMTKAVQERLFLCETPGDGLPRFACVRYGNVIGSRGSVVPLFKRLLEEGKPIPITHTDMTRFLLTLDEAIDLVFTAACSHEANAVYVRKMPACRIVDLAQVMGEALTGKPPMLLMSGVRPGEKIHEVLVSEEELTRTTEFGEYFCIWPSQSCIGDSRIENEYCSNTTAVLTLGELRAVLKKDGWI